MDTLNIEVIGLVVTFVTFIVGIALTLQKFNIRNTQEHNNLMHSIDKIVEDCKISNIDCRKRLDEANKYFIDKLDNIIVKLQPAATKK